MSRNGSGTFLTPSAAFISGTKLVATPVNLNFADIATALTMSISADGQTPITAPIQFSNGVAAAPGVTFAGDKTTGHYLPTAGQLGFAVSGASAGVWSTSGLASATFASTAISSPTLAGTVTITSTTFTYGTGSAAAQLLGMAMNAVLPYQIFLGGGGIVPGLKGFFEIPFPCVIDRWTLLADQSGSAVLDVWRAPYASFPPNSGNSITSGAPPTLSGQRKAQSAAGGMVGVTLNAGDWLGLNVNSAATVTRLNLSLFVTRTAQ